MLAWAPAVRSRVWLYYDREDNHWHERLCLAPGNDGAWIVATPDFDIYEEFLEDAIAWEMGKPHGGRPTRFSAASLHGFGPLTEVQIDHLVAQGQQAARAAEAPVPGDQGDKDNRDSADNTYNSWRQKHGIANPTASSGGTRSPNLPRAMCLHVPHTEL